MSHRFPLAPFSVFATLPWLISVSLDQVEYMLAQR